MDLYELKLELTSVIEEKSFIQKKMDSLNEKYNNLVFEIQSKCPHDYIDAERESWINGDIIKTCMFCNKICT